MSASLLLGNLKGQASPAKIGALQLDASVSESHDYQNEISEFPAEDGSTIIDNIRVLPDRVTINGIVSDAPVSVLFDKVTDIVTSIPNGKQATRVSRDDTATRVESARDILLRIRGTLVNGTITDPEIVDVVTGLRVYKNMALQSLRFDRSARTGQSLPFTAIFVQVKTAEIVFEDIPEPAPEVADTASNQVKKGKQKAVETSQENTVLVSRARALFNGLVN